MRAREQSVALSAATARRKTQDPFCGCASFAPTTYFHARDSRLPATQIPTIYPYPGRKFREGDI